VRPKKPRSPRDYRAHLDGLSMSPLSGCLHFFMSAYSLTLSKRTATLNFTSVS
jgi:hypothetical protein